MDDLSWMSRTYCLSDRYPELKKPGIAVVDGKSFAFCSDGHYFIAIETTNGFDRVLELDGRAKAVMLPKKTTEPPMSVSLSNLKKWLGPAQWDKICRKCDGDGCEKCDYEGGIFCDPRYGKLFGIFIDKNLLARALDKFIDETVQISFTGERTVFYVESDGWLVGQMPCQDVEAQDEFPDKAEGK